MERGGGCLATASYAIVTLIGALILGGSVVLLSLLPGPGGGAAGPPLASASLDGVSVGLEDWGVAESLCIDSLLLQGPLEYFVFEVKVEGDGYAMPGSPVLVLPQGRVEAVDPLEGVFFVGSDLPPCGVAVEGAHPLFPGVKVESGSRVVVVFPAGEYRGEKTLELPFEEPGALLRFTVNNEGVVAVEAVVTES